METQIPYRHPAVRDLAWALGSPPLLQPGHDDLYWPDDHWFSAIADDFRQQLGRLDENPVALLERIDACKDQRLGKYFETLWQHWLEQNLRYRLVYANLPLRVGGRTLGEFDFLVEDRLTGKILHWELAVKFYLGAGDTRQSYHWWGPGLRDRLDIKTEHLMNHQGNLSRLPEAQRILQGAGIQVDETWALMKGRLFYPAGSETPSPSGSSIRHLRGFWMTVRKFESITIDDHDEWLVLNKRQWLAPLSAEHCQQSLPRKKICNAGVMAAMQRPVCVARVSRGEETERGFIVPDSWETAANAAGSFSL